MDSASLRWIKTAAQSSGGASRAVAAELAAQLKDGNFDELVLVAPPGVITELKHSLSKSTAKVVVKELHKDLTKVPDHELTKHLSTSS